MNRKQPIGPHTQVCAIIGNPLGHSLSPAIHNAAFEELDLDFVYVAFRVEDPGAALCGMRAMENFRGMSVTIPHKIEVMRHVDEIADVDRHIGSINTILNDKGRLTGLGTDGPGALKALKDAGADLDGARVLMLGAGGAARAIAFTLAGNERLAELCLLDVNTRLLDGLVSDLKAGTGAFIQSGVLNEEHLTDVMARADIIIHCTPVGMHPNVNESLVPARLFRRSQVVFDVVYNPLKTRLLAEAEASGLRTLSGVEMFIHQAVLQFEAFTGREAPIEVMRRVAMEHLTT